MNPDYIKNPNPDPNSGAYPGEIPHEQVNGKDTYPDRHPGEYPEHPDAQNHKQNQNLIITWHGHSCFSVTYDQFTLVIDPYKDNAVPGLVPLSLFAEEVYVTHDHGDHNYTEAVTIRENSRKSPFTLTRIESYHDDSEGKKRGTSDILLFEREDVRFAHLGDLGEELSDEKIASLQNLDAVMIPVGGHYTLDPQEAKSLMDRLNARVVIPMHYRTERFGYSEVRPLEDFLSLVPDAVFYDNSSVIINRDTPDHTAILPYE